MARSRSRQHGRRRVRKNPQRTWHDFVAHSWIWGGVGMLIRGGYFGPFWNPGLGLLSIAYGFYDLSKPKPEATGTAEAPSTDFHLFPAETPTAFIEAGEE